MEYYELKPEDNTFKTLSVQTTYKCQMKCSNCYLGHMLNNEHYKDVDLNKLKLFLERLPKRCDIRFIGAEPTMNPQLFDLIKIARQTGHRPSLLTNGLKLRKEDYVIQLKQAGLKLLGISMNGGLDDEMYQLFDNGKYAKSKTIALENCFKHKILPHINVILAPPNVHILNPLANFIIKSALKHKRHINPITYPVMLRVKSIGKIGNYMDTKTFTLKELKEIVNNELKINITPDYRVDGFDEKRSLTFEWYTNAGEMLGKLTDWTIDDDGVPDSGSIRRGIITENYTIAPFFEYYANEHKTVL